MVKNGRLKSAGAASLLKGLRKLHTAMVKAEVAHHVAEVKLETARQQLSNVIGEAELFGVRF